MSELSDMIRERRKQQEPTQERIYAGELLETFFGKHIEIGFDRESLPFHVKLGSVLLYTAK